MKLIHLGCFDQPVDNWSNFDITPHLFISRIPILPLLLYKCNLINKIRYLQHKNGIFKKVKYLNLNKPLKFDDNSVDAFFSSHVLEHLFLYKTKNLLKEIYRTLKPGGFIRIVLPDLDLLVKKYDEYSPDIFVNELFENSNSNNYKNFHKYMFTKYSFSKYLAEAGFEKDSIEILSYKNTNFPPFLELDNRPDNSFYIEARK